MSVDSHRRRSDLSWLVRTNAAAPSLEDYRARPPHPNRVEGGKKARRGAPSVSIVTVVLNGERHIQSAIDSVRNQTVDHFEFVVVDGGSTDRTLQILKANETVIDHWISEPDKGIYDAMNKGIALCRGRQVKLLNADDELCPEGISHAVAARRSMTVPCVVRSEIEIIGQRGEMVKMMRRPPAGCSKEAELFYVLHPSWFVDMEIYERHGLYERNFRISADYELFLRLRANDVPFIEVDTALARFRQGGASAGFRGIRERLEINQRYLGGAVAARALMTHTYRKLRGRAAAAVLGPERASRVGGLLQRARDYLA